MTTISTVMATQLVTAEAHESVTVVAKRMADNGVGAVLIVDKERLIGVVSERDLLTRVLAKHFDADTTGVGDICTPAPATLDTGQSLKDALGIFRMRKFRHLPVVDEKGKPVGLVSTTDLHAYLLDELERFVDDLKYKKLLADGVDPYDHFGGQYGR